MYWLIRTVLIASIIAALLTVFVIPYSVVGPTLYGIAAQWFVPYSFYVALALLIAILFILRFDLDLTEIFKANLRIDLWLLSIYLLLWIGLTAYSIIIGFS